MGNQPPGAAVPSRDDPLGQKIERIEQKRAQPVYGGESGTFLGAAFGSSGKKLGRDFATNIDSIPGACGADHRSILPAAPRRPQRWLPRDGRRPA